jgi:hypothetical protein
MMKKSVMTCASLLLVCLWLTSGAWATIVDANDEWLMKLEPEQTITCVAHFIPDIPTVVPDSLVFTKAPEWTDAYPFNYVGAGWDTAISEDGKAAYLYGPEIYNDTNGLWQLFSYSLFYQWDDEDPYYDENYPVWVDIAVFNDQELLVDGSVRGIPGGPWDDVNEDTWKEQYDPESDPYINPIPEPMTICLLGLGTVFLRKRR